MRQYELIVIVQPDLDETTLSGVIERVKEMITGNEGEILKEEIWGSRRMAYAIKNFREGYYVYMEVSFAPEFGAELKQNLRYVEPVLRYMLVKKED